MEAPRQYLRLDPPISMRQEMRQIICPPVSTEVGAVRVTRKKYQVSEEILRGVQNYAPDCSNSEVLRGLGKEGINATLKDVRFARSLLEM